MCRAQIASLLKSVTESSKVKYKVIKVVAGVTSVPGERWVVVCKCGGGGGGVDGA